MKKIIKNTITLIAGFVGLIGGFYWCFQSAWQTEPLILVIISSLEIIGYFTINPTEDKKSEQNQNSNQNVNVNVNVSSSRELSNEVKKPLGAALDRAAALDIMKSKTNVLFIDDDKNFKVVKILKESGWRNTKTVPDIKTLDVQAVKDSDIIFVDINGVGKILNLEFEGLDLALMLKQKYVEKKVIIYSANRISNSFHDAWDACDYKLEKNALPYQFQNLVEEFSLQNYKSN